MSFNIQHPTPDDLQRVFDFIIACDIAEYGAPDSDFGDLSDQWREADLSADAWISLDEQGALNGYALFSRTSDTRCDLDSCFNVLSSPPELREALYDLGLARFKETAAPGCLLVIYLNARDRRACGIAEAHGFTVKKYHYRMQLDFTTPYPAPDWPAEYALGSYTDAAEDELFELIVTAFDWEGVAPFDHASWKRNVFRNGRINPDDFILVRRADRLVAAALCYNEGDLLWLKELAVSKDMQGRGLGSLLLKHVFSTYSRQGVPTVALGVVSTNPKAAAIYEHVGMTRTREFVQYELIL